jgi:molecular chaperone GrpE
VEGSEEREREQEDDRPRVKVTDRRRVRADGEANVSPSAPATAAPADPPAAADGPGALDAAKRKAAEYLEHLQRLQAEFDNFRKRELKLRTAEVERAAEPVIRRLLEVLDEFELALMSAEKKPDFDRFLHGVELVYAKLTDILRSEGLERIEAQGRPFDPTQHEALMQTGDGDGEPVVADVLRPGYTMKGRVIRPAGVRVTRP